MTATTIHISPNVTILTLAELRERENAAFQRGVERGNTAAREQAHAEGIERDGEAYEKGVQAGRRIGVREGIERAAHWLSERSALFYSDVQAADVIDAIRALATAPTTDDVCPDCGVPTDDNGEYDFIRGQHEDEGPTPALLEGAALLKSLVSQATCKESLQVQPTTTDDVPNYPDPGPALKRAALKSSRLVEPVQADDVERAPLHWGAIELMLEAVADHDADLSDSFKMIIKGAISAERDAAREQAHAQGVREGIERAAELCENHAERPVRGIILAPELAGEFPDDGDEFAPILPDHGAVATVANELAKVRLQIAAAGIRALATPETQEEKLP